MLVSLCLASRELRDIALPVLYSKVKIDDMRHAMNMGLPMLLEMTPAGKEHLVQTRWFTALGRDSEFEREQRRWDRRHPHEPFRPDVENPKYDIDDDDDPYDSRLTAAARRSTRSTTARPTSSTPSRFVTPRAIDRFLAVCPNVETAHFTRADVEFFEPSEELGFVEVLAKRAPKLSTLSIVDFTTNEDATEYLLEDLALLPNLRHLALTCLPRDSSEWQEPSASELVARTLPQALESLHLGSTVSPAFLAAVAKNSYGSLVSLGVAVRRVPVDLAPFVHVRHLAVAYGQVARVPAVLRTLAHPDRLESLELRYSPQIAAAEYDDRRKRDTREREYYYEDDDDDDDDDDESTDWEDEEGDGPRGLGGGKDKKEKKPRNPWIALFRAVPASVTRVSIPYTFDRSTVEPDEFLAAVKSDSFPPPSVRTVVLAHPGRDDDPPAKRGQKAKRIDSDDYEALEERANGRHLTKVAKVLEAKGVDLVRIQDWRKYKERWILDRRKANDQ
ncbi:hypothetical protein JCM11491_002838 [Sporobolomyces phaffii]